MVIALDIEGQQSQKRSLEAGKRKFGQILIPIGQDRLAQAQFGRGSIGDGLPVVTEKKTTIFSKL